MGDLPDFTKGDWLNDRYEIQGLIARGGMGETYWAIDRQTKDTVAVKVLDFEEIKEWKQIDLFEREIRALKNLNHHNIPKYLDNFKTVVNGKTFFALVQEHIKGKNLLQLIEQGKRFTYEQVLSIFETLLSVLDYIHNIQPPIIHRDINPKNVILDETGKVYLVDFGAAGSVTKDTVSAGSTFIGTVGYMPPEQIYGKAVPASDLYSLALTIIFLLTGVPPEKLINENNEIAYHSRVNVPDNLIILLDKMLVPEQTKRVSNANKALDFLSGKVKALSPEIFDSGDIKDSNAVYTIEENEDGTKTVSTSPNTLNGMLYLLIGIVMLIGFIIVISVESRGDRRQLFNFYGILLGAFVIGFTWAGIYNVRTSDLFEMSGEGFKYYIRKGNSKSLYKSISFDDFLGTEIEKHRGNNKTGTTYTVIIKGKDGNITLGRRKSFDLNDAEALKDNIDEYASAKLLY